MPKQKLFDDESDEEVEIIKTENEYAKKYDTWREKEEIHKLEQKYGPKALTSDASSSDSEDDDEPPEVSEEMEEQFLKTLALLKTKDPRIYDPEFKAFDEKEKETVKETKKPTLTFADSDEDDEGDGNIFSIEKKAEVEQQDNDQKQERSKGGGGKEVKIKEYLTGKKEHIDSPIEKDLAPLKALWSDPNINEGEAFLRDYILNKKYLEDGDIGEAEDRLRDDDELEADEQMVEEQGKFERAYNFRFEEPDQEYLKRFPRTMNFIRPKDDKRSRKRAEIRTRKEEEKRRKMEDIARLKSLKLKEIQEKIEKIKEVTGNQELAFKEDDIEGDFDPEEHDRRMKALFDEQYYGGEEREKPVFPDLDKELEIENWDNYDPDSEKNTQQDDGDGFHCEDAEFNMDADFNPKQAQRNLLEEIQQTLGKKRRNRKKKSKLAKLLEADKPKFIPTDEDKTYAEYMEEYYKMDCEDVIGGDLPTRFKYREVVANDYGLTVEEILLADDRELTQWVPLKKIVKHRPESVQKSEINTYRQKAGDVSLKRKMLPSLFKHLPEEPELVVSQETKKKKKKNKRKQNNQVENSEETGPNDADNTEDISETVEIKKDKKKKDKKHKDAENEDSNVENNQDNVNQQVESIDNEFQSTDKKDKKKKNKKQKNIDIEHSVTEINQNSLNEQSGASDIELNTIDKDIKQKDKHKSIENYDKTQIPKVGGQTEKKNKQILTNETDTNNPTHKEHNSVSETTKQKHNSETNTQSSTETIEIKQNGGNKKKRKKNKNNGFNIEVIQNATPSKGSENTNKKRKLDNNSSAIPSKKKKNNKYKNKDNKWNKNDKFKKNQNDKSNDDPLSRLSDERLKAYGLNPKKYRSFLKYKKF